MSINKSELLGNSITNYVRHNLQGMVADGWRDLDVAGLLQEEFSDSYTDNSCIKRYYAANDKVVSSAYAEMCDVFGIDPKTVETIEYRVVLYPIGDGNVDMAVWVRDHGNVESWKIVVDTDGQQVLQLFERASSKHFARPYVNWELMAYRRATGVTVDWMRNQDEMLQNILDAHMDNIQSGSSLAALKAKRGANLYV